MSNAMVSSTPHLKSARPAWPRALGALLLALAALLGAAPAAAEGIVPVSARVESTEHGYRLDAEFDIQFSSRLVEAVFISSPCTNNRYGIPVSQWTIRAIHPSGKQRPQ